jgi:hypothetical protein
MLNLRGRGASCIYRAPGTTGKTGEQDAGPAAYYKLTLSISDGVKSITRSTASTTLSGSTPFYAQAVMLLEENRTALRDAFPDAAARDILDAGIAAYQGSDADWESFVDLYGDVLEEHDSDFLNRDATFAQLIGTHVFTYKKDFDTANLSRKSKIEQNTPRYATILCNIKRYF